MKGVNLDGTLKSNIDSSRRGNLYYCLGEHRIL